MNYIENREANQMKIIKTESKTKALDVYQKGFSGFVKSFKKNGKRNLIVICSLLLIGGAVWLNWALFSKADTGEDYDPSISSVGATTAGSSNQTSTGDDPADSVDSTDSYFAMAQIDRTRARDEALEVLYQITSSEDATEEAKENAYASIAKLSSLIEQEANIEALIKSKGISECVAVLNGETANIIVCTDGLTDSQTAQVAEIVYKQAGITPENLTIIEKSPN
ncbi:MAG: SpoIIIAH-like family protein [Eubacteriales bacterium]